MTAALFSAVTGHQALAQDAAAKHISPVALATKGFDLKSLDPIDGISVRDYVHIVFAMYAADQKDAGNVPAAYQFDKARFDAISAMMTEYFRKDPTRKFSEIYSAYFQEQAGGPFSAHAVDYAQSVLNGGPLKLKEPMSFERYMQLSQFYAEGAQKQKPMTREASDKVLEPTGIAFIDFQVLGAWYGRRMARNPKR
jgi:hypothetical protein